MQQLDDSFADNEKEDRLESSINQQAVASPQRYDQTCSRQAPQQYDVAPQRHGSAQLDSVKFGANDVAQLHSNDLAQQRHSIPLDAGHDKLSPIVANMSEFDSRLYGSLYSDASFASSFNPDNISIDRHPVYSG